MRNPILFAIPLALAAVASAQTCITSPPGFAGGNGGNPGGIVFFDVDVVAPNGVSFTSMDLNLDSATMGATVSCDIFARIGSSHVGNEGNPGWSFITTGAGTMQSSGTPTTLAFNSTFWLPLGINGVAIVAKDGASHDYTNGNGSNQSVSNADLTLLLGSASNGFFTSSVFTPRVANTTLCYNLGGMASYPYFDVSRRSGAAPLQVDFTDRSWSIDPSGVATWQWDFDGDGTIDLQGSTPAEQNPTWIYSNPGTFSVALSIIDSLGVTTFTRANLITVAGPTNNTDSADVLHYTFNEPPRAGNMRVYNAASTDIAPRFGTMSQDDWQGDPMRAGFAGGEPGFGCLGEAGAISSNALDTGLALEVSDMTIAFWHRVGQTGANTANAFAYVLGGPSDSQRVFIGGSAGTGRIRYAGTGAGNVDNQTDFKTGLADVWTHLALVVDDQAGTATWYLNGAPDGSVSFTPGSHQVARDEFWVGFHNGTQNYSLFYSMDDFRLYSRALSGVEITALASSTEPGVGAIYGDGCPAANAVVPQIGAAGGAPAIGNVLFEITLDDADPNSLAGLVFGSLANSQTPAGGALPQALTPFGVGFPSGCNLEVGGIITTVFVLQSTGSASLAFPIPPVPAFAGFHFRAQWGVLGPQFAVSPALDIALR